MKVCGNFEHKEFKVLLEGIPTRYTDLTDLRKYVMMYNKTQSHNKFNPLTYETRRLRTF